MSLKDIYSPIAAQMQQMESILAATIRDSQNPKVAEIAEIVIQSPGKRLRPALAFLVSNALSVASLLSSEQNENLLKMGSAFELIHMASLVHDDVMDESDMRHNLPTVNAKYGNDTAIAFGDFLYALTYQLTANCNSVALHNCMSRATREMCEGELLQVCERENWNLTQESYTTIIRKKTAGLFASACESGAIIAEADQKMQDAMNRFGTAIGIAFQMIDDFLDLTAEVEKLGKTPGQDIGVGKLTLPLILYMETCNDKEKEAFIKLCQSGKPNTLQLIKSKIQDTDIPERTLDKIHGFIFDGKKELDKLKPSEYKDSLLNLLTFIQIRLASYLPQPQKETA